MTFEDDEREDQRGKPASFRLTDDLFEVAKAMAGEDLISLSAVYRRSFKRDADRWLSSRAVQAQEARP